MTPNDQALAVLRVHGRSFHFASHLLSTSYRTRAARLYAFCRYVDDLVDETNDPELANLTVNHLKTELLSGQSEHPQVQSMIRLMQEIDLPIDPVLALIDGVQSDLNVPCLQNEAELIQYAYKVAGTVGLMMCAVLDVKNPAALPFAIDLGVAMQLTNIARDVAEDALLGRIYLPAEWLENLTVEDIKAPNSKQQQNLEDATRRILLKADNYYESGLDGLVYLPTAARYGILAAAAVYRDIGNMIAKSGYQSWNHRAVVPTHRKCVCAAGSIIKYFAQSLWGRAEPVHKPHLHRHLQSCFGANSMNTHG